MAEAKIEIKVGAISFSGEGDGKWLSEQLDKILEKIPELANVIPALSEEGKGDSSGSAHKKAMGTLASFLAQKNAKSNKTRKFLAVALWLQDTQGKKRLTTSDVTTAVSNHSQGSLGNAAQCLILNAKQGFCTREGKQFYVTEEGRAQIS